MLKQFKEKVKKDESKSDEYVKKKKNIADIFTKALPWGTFSWFQQVGCWRDGFHCYLTQLVKAKEGH